MPLLFSAEEIKLFEDIHLSRVSYNKQDHYAQYLDLLAKKEKTLNGLIEEYERFQVLETSDSNEQKESQIIPAGKEYSGRKALKDIIKDTQHKVQIIDPYFKGDEAFSLLLVLPNSIHIEILTSTKSNNPSLAIDLEKFKTEWGGQISIKTNDGLHGRNIIIDDKDVFVIDHSLKDAGKALTSIHKPFDTKEVISHFLEKWGSGEKLNIPTKTKDLTTVFKGDKYQIRKDLIERGVSIWKEKGQAKDFLLREYEYLKDKGWSREEFEEIYKTISLQHKGKEPKSKLFTEG